MITFMLLVITTLLFLYIMGVHLYDTFSEDRKKLNRFPGPKPLFFFGNLFEYFKSPADLFKMIREFGINYYPAYKLKTLGYAHIVIISPHNMQQVLNNTKHNEKSIVYKMFERWLGEGLLLSGGDKWIHRRKILTPTFHFTILKKFIYTFVKHCEIFEQELGKTLHEEINIVPYVHTCSLHMIQEAAMGVEINDEEREEKYRKAVHRIAALKIYQVTRPWLHFRWTYIFHKHFYEEFFILHYLKSLTKSVIEQRTKTHNQEISSNDESNGKRRMAMLDLLISAKKDNLIDDKGIAEEVDTFMFEGHDTISMAISFCYMLLACHKDIQDRVYNEMISVLGEKAPEYDDLQKLTYTEMVIKETLRLYPSVPTISRVTGEEIVCEDGNIIPANTVIFLHIYDTHHNPNVYPDPEKFDPERFSIENSKNRHPFAYLPFSAGSRNCIGQRYAVLAMKTMLVYVLRHYELHPVDTPETIVLTLDIVLRAADGIKVKLTPRIK